MASTAHTCDLHGHVTGGSETRGGAERGGVKRGRSERGEPREGEPRGGPREGDPREGEPRGGAKRGRAKSRGTLTLLGSLNRKYFTSIHLTVLSLQTYLSLMLDVFFLLLCGSRKTSLPSEYYLLKCRYYISNSNITCIQSKYALLLHPIELEFPAFDDICKLLSIETAIFEQWRSSHYSTDYYWEWPASSVREQCIRIISLEN